jgi:NitT/TauT family transport system substrate-binding protein
MKRIIQACTMTAAAAAMAGTLLAAATSAQAEKIRIALAEPPSDEVAHIFVALDRAKKMGLEYEWTASRSRRS